MENKIFENFGLEVTKGVLAKFIQAILGFVGVVVFARLLGPTDFGSAYLLISVVGILKQVSGYEAAAKQRFANQGSDDREIVGAVGLFNTLVIAVTIILAFIFEPYLVSYVGLANAKWLLIALLSALVLFSPYQTLLGAQGLLGRQVMIDTIRSVATLAFQLILILSGFGAAGVIYGTAGATILCLPLTQHSLGVRPTFPSRETVKSLWEYTKYVIPTSFIGKAYSEYDMVLIGFLLTQEAAGYYQAALKLTLPAIFLSQIAGSGLMSEVSNLHSQKESFTSELTNTLSFASLLSIPLFFGALAMPDLIIVTVYEPAYRSAATLLVGLALYRIVKSQSTPYRQTLLGMDRPDIVFRIDTVTLCLNLVLGYILVLQIGALGAVLATVGAESLRYGINAHVVRTSVNGVPLVPRPVWHQIAAGVAMFGVVTVVRAQIQIHSFLPLLILVLVGAGVYFSILVVISRQFRNTVISILEPIIINIYN